VLALVLGLIWRARHTAPFVFRGVLFYLANILLALPFYTVGTFELRADRYSYLAILGIFAILAGLPVFLKEKRPKLAENLWVVLGGFALICLLLTASRIRDWRDTIVLIDAAVEQQGANAGKAYLWKGMAYGDKGSVKEALESFSKAIQVNPDLTDAYKYRGGLLGIIKQYERSLEDLNKYLEKTPDDAEILYNRSLTLVNLKRWEEALDDLNKTLELAPEFTRAYRARGNVRKQLGDAEGGAADLQEFDRRSALEQ
jgi:tetratricopeptide (TPR) repeat protein